MKAVIMAGGEGTRLRPLTSNQPKPMMPLGNRPMMEHVVNLLRTHGLDDIVVTVAFMPTAIRYYFGDGSAFGVRMAYAQEETPLGTAGSVGNAKAQLQERFLVISGDVLTDIDLSAIVDLHEQRGALATIALVRAENPLDFGIVITREDGSIERFLEKPSWGQVFSDTINTGIFVLEPEIFDYIPEGKAVDFSSEVFPAVLEDGKGLYGAVADGYWEDVGTLDAYVRAHRDMLDGRVRVELPGFRLAEGVWLGEGADIDPEAVVVGPAIIGDNCRVESGCRIGEYTVLGANVRLRNGVDLERAVIHDNAYLGESVRLRGTVVGRACDLRKGVRAEEGVVIGDECFVGENAVLAAGVKVYPFKTVEADAVINASIVWESRGARSLFARDGVKGLANVDITPEVATRLAMAYGTTLRAGSTVVTSRDSSRAARMLKRAMMAGLNAAGVNVVDLEVASVPLTRFMVRQSAYAGGLTVRIVQGEPQSIIVRFFESDAVDMGEAHQRRIERLLGREDYRRVFPAEIGDIGFALRPLENYANALESTVDVAGIQAAGFKAVIDYSYGTTAFLMPQVLAKLGSEVLSVNPYASTSGAAEFDRTEHAAHVADLVRTSRAQIGAVIDPDGEHLTLVDDKGHVLTDLESLHVLLGLITKKLLGDRVALPVNASSVAERIVRSAGYDVEYTELSTSAVMAAAARPGVGFAATLNGGFILPGFLCAFDAAAMFVKVLDLLATGDEPLSALVAALPPTAVVSETVITPWEQKGAVMRSLIELNADREVLLVDGVKLFHDDGWVLAVPDPEEPITRVWAEGHTEQEARRLAQEYARRIRQLLR